MGVHIINNRDAGIHNAELVRNNSVLMTELDGEICMMSIENGRYYGMDSVGTRIWELLECANTCRAIVSSLVDEYDVDEATCMRETSEYLQHLVDEGLVLVKRSID